MIDRVALKARAKEFAFSHKWAIWRGILLFAAIEFAIYFVFGFIMGLTGASEESMAYSIIQLIINIAVIPMQVGLIDYVVNVVREKEVDLKECFFKYYKKEYIWNVLKITIVAYLIIFALSLLLVIPGIIWALKYAMIFYIIVDKSAKELETDNVRKESEAMMDGHKWEFFVFQLSFILWYLLVCCTLYIAAIWVIPYVATAHIMFYDELKKLSK